MKKILECNNFLGGYAFHYWNDDYSNGYWVAFLASSFHISLIKSALSNREEAQAVSDYIESVAWLPIALASSPIPATKILESKFIGKISDPEWCEAVKLALDGLYFTYTERLNCDNDKKPEYMVLPTDYSEMSSKVKAQGLLKTLFPIDSTSSDSLSFLIQNAKFLLDDRPELHFYPMQLVREIRKQVVSLTKPDFETSLKDSKLTANDAYTVLIALIRGLGVYSDKDLLSYTFNESDEPNESDYIEKYLMLLTTDLVQSLLTVVLPPKILESTIRNAIPLEDRLFPKN